MDKSLKKDNPKYPLLLIPVIRCVFEFLNIAEVKNCRLVCRDWGSIGKPALASRALIRLRNYEIPGESKRGRRPADFQSCFPGSTSRFSAFEIFGDFKTDSAKNPWTLEELSKFFEDQQKYIKELKLHFNYLDETLLKKITLSSWISKSPMVQKDAKYLTKLTVRGVGNRLDMRPFHLIAHIKELSLSECRIHVEEGIKMRPIKLKLSEVTFHKDGVELNDVPIHEIVDFCNSKEVSIRNWGRALYLLDSRCSITLEKLFLDGDDIEIVNGEASEWVIEHLTTTWVPYSLSSQMKIKELSLYQAGDVDLVDLPNSIQNLLLQSVNHQILVRCRQPIALPNLKYLELFETFTNFAFLSHFLNCPQLTHLKLYQCTQMNLKTIWIPKTVKIVTLQACDCGIKLLDENTWNLETLVVDNFKSAQQLCETKIRVDNFVFYSYNIPVDKRLSDFLEKRQRFGFCKRLYLGELKWKDKKLEESVLKEYVDVKASFYVFQDGQKGQAVPETAFYQITPEDIEMHSYMYA